MLETKDERMQLRLTAEMAKRIRALAEIHNRPFQDQIRHLLMIGLESPGSKESLVKPRRAASHPVTDGQLPLPAPPSSAVTFGHAPSRGKRGAA
jgi:hypothetical protein